MISLAVVGVGSAFGAWLHYRKDRFHPRAAAVFAVSGSLGAIVGAQMRQRRCKNRGAGFRVGRCLAVGVLTGFLGVGGGFLLVPAMILVAGLDTRQAVASSLAVIAVNSLAGLAGHLWVGSAVPVDSLSALVTVMAGMVAGTVLGGRLEAPSIEKVFAALVLVTGAVVVA